MNSVVEPLEESAPLARRIAERMCRTDPDTGQCCSWYHGFWQYLRILDLVTTPAHHADFYRDAFQDAVPASGSARVLISGAIDYSMLAHVLWAYSGHRSPPNVTVVDICETPLFLNHWYARYCGALVQTACSDFLTFESATSFDVICTHSFFGQFSPAQRPALMDRWWKLLKPGGSVVAVNRIRPGGSKDRTGFSIGQAQALRDTVLEKLKMPHDLPGITREEVERYADAYAARRRPYPVASQEELAGMFENAGFSIAYLSCCPVIAGGELSGPTLPGGAEYAQIIARRN